MRKRLIFILALSCALILTMSFGSVSAAFAAEDDGAAGGYGYVIKIYPGMEGTYNGSDSVTTLNKKYGDSVTIDVKDVKVKDDRYYPRGFRIAGHDNDEMEGETITGFTKMTFDVKEDVNYEVAYGIRGEMVPYTVRYVDDATGKVIKGIADDTYYGMPGDKPVVSYKYIEGYQPNVLYMAKKLTTDPSQNVFEFRYTAGAAAGTTTTTVTRVVPAAPGTAANPAGTNVGAAANANANANANAGNDGAATIGDSDTPLANAPQQFTDLDEGETPLADGSSGGTLAGIAPFLVGGAVVLLGILALLWYLFGRRGEEEDEEEEATYDHA